MVIYRKYDLKGSTVDREASDKEKEKELPTLKDNDFVKDGTKVVIGDEAKERLMETLTADVEVFRNLLYLFCVSFTSQTANILIQFLMKLQMMDYSLLLGVHDCVQAEQENLERRERPERNKHNKSNYYIYLSHAIIRFNYLYRN